MKLKTDQGKPYYIIWDCEEGETTVIPSVEYVEFCMTKHWAHLSFDVRELEIGKPFSDMEYADVSRKNEIVCELMEERELEEFNRQLKGVVNGTITNT